ncbi:hypothetical protein H6F46_18230 [Limnothrix sp. FACHB-1083]|uniref:hypothetical protein n=1 Tax=unclassified Limnothrix TaxID=2632864 RepID=UPI001680EE60|nr:MULTISPECIES: hypothetical protein [unclassified Limnothrix]MBD2162630.1 hypothetical protein [Limnothrix sp. FACHB-1083]MBD2193666.1 hypothetical protein [Limnothrix sp. FACHB-1088]
MIEIVDQTPNRLQLHDRDWNWLGLGLLGLPFVTVGLIVGLAVSNRTTLNCQRLTTNPKSMVCQRIIDGYLGQNTLIIREPLMRASVRRTSGVGVVLYFSKTPELELVNHRIIVSYKQEIIANKINNFIQNSQIKTLNVVQDDYLEGLMSGLMFLLPGLFLMIQGVTTPMLITCAFDKTSDRVTIFKQYLFKISKTIEAPLSQISEIKLQESSLLTKKPCFYLQLIWKPRENCFTPMVLKIDNWSSSTMISGLHLDADHLRKIISIIRLFLP